MSALCARSISRPAGRDYFFVLVNFRKAKIKRGFRVLRDTTQGSALRTRKPLKRFDRNFNYGCGAEWDSAQLTAQNLDLFLKIFETSVIFQHKITFLAIKCLIRLRVDACGGGGFT